MCLFTLDDEGNRNGQNSERRIGENRGCKERDDFPSSACTDNHQSLAASLSAPGEAHATLSDSATARGRRFSLCPTCYAN